MQSDALLITLVTLCVIWQPVQCSIKAMERRIDRAMITAQQVLALRRAANRQYLVQGTDKGDLSTYDMLLLLETPSAGVRELAAIAALQVETLKAAKPTPSENLIHDPDFLFVWKDRFKFYCAKAYQVAPCDTNAFYRTADGSCNNLKEPAWGAALSPEIRELPPVYNDEISSPRQVGSNRRALPSARAISNTVHQVESGISPRNPMLTMMVMQWGQFIDHDIVQTPVFKGEGGAKIDCCKDQGSSRRAECFSINIRRGDPYFGRAVCMNLVRSSPTPHIDCGPGVQQQLNQVTSWIDGSAVYGSNINDTLNLRELTGGLMKVLGNDENELLPATTPDKCALHEDHPEEYCQAAGDARVNVVPSLGLSHLAFVRLHNKFAKEISQRNRFWPDEAVFQEARRAVAAILQIITYNEYLPAILDNDTLDDYGLSSSEPYAGVKDWIIPNIANVFAAAAFRFGHSQIADYMGVMDANYTFTQKENIVHTYHNPHMVEYNNGSGLDGMGRWLISDPTPLADGLFGDGVRNKLFKDKKADSLDLPAINIQRGRDHGLPPYNSWRRLCGLPEATMDRYRNFILPNHTEEQTAKLQDVYSNVEDLDLYSTAMTETLIPGSSVGPTFACLIGRQFRRLKEADRFWYESTEKNIKFTKPQLDELKKMTLARVLCDVFTIEEIQPNVFKVPGPGNERVPCSTIPAMKMKRWKFPCVDKYYGRYHSRP